MTPRVFYGAIPVIFVVVRAAHAIISVRGCLPTNNYRKKHAKCFSFWGYVKLFSQLKLFFKVISLYVPEQQNGALVYVKGFL